MLAELLKIYGAETPNPELYSLEFVLTQAPLRFSEKFAQSCTAWGAEMAQQLAHSKLTIDRLVTDRCKKSGQLRYWREMQAEGRPVEDRLRRLDREWESLHRRTIEAKERRHLLEQVRDWIGYRNDVNLMPILSGDELFEEEDMPNFPTLTEEEDERLANLALYDYW
jgi:hypothetical protein